MNLRIGQGYDSHALVPDRPLYIGGALIPSPLGSKGHSDGDCLLHALIDCLLGATAQGDIGSWFPDTDEQYRGIRSTKLLERVLQSPDFPSCDIVNLDITLFLDTPKMKPHRELIRSSLADLLSLDISQISLKAKTWEGIGPLPSIAASVTGLISLR